MVSDLVVFRSTDPAVRAAFLDARKRYDDWAVAIAELAREVHPDAKPMVTHSWGMERFGGITKVDPVPDGWRIDQQRAGYSPMLVPRRSTKEGKAWLKRIEELRSGPNVRASLLGMPGGGAAGLAYESPGIEIYDDCLYVIWGHDPADLDMGWNPQEAADEVDPKLWERVKLSQYYADKEAREAKRSEEVTG